jgi:hypothetical protein
MRILSAVALLASILPGVPRAESAASLAVVDLDPLGDASGAPHDRLYARLSYRSAEPVRFIAHGFSGGERAGESIVGSDWQLVSERLPDCLRHPGPARGRGRLVRRIADGIFNGPAAYSGVAGARSTPELKRSTAGRSVTVTPAGASTLSAGSFWRTQSARETVAR